MVEAESYLSPRQYLVCFVRCSFRQYSRWKGATLPWAALMWCLWQVGGLCGVGAGLHDSFVQNDAKRNKNGVKVVRPSSVHACFPGDRRNIGILSAQCVGTVSRHSYMSVQCVGTVCRHSVSAQCVSTECRHSVSALYRHSILANYRRRWAVLAQFGPSIGTVSAQ